MQASAFELERQVQSLGPRPDPADRRCGVRWEAGFAQLLKALSPRIGRLIRRYGLSDIREDAEQVCAVAVLRALGSYDPGKARFTTHVTWQLRGELQSLRHRMRLDQRQSARSAGVRTVSLDALQLSDDAGRTTFEIVDERALDRAECLASDHMAATLLTSLLDRIGSPVEERALVTRQVFAAEGATAADRKTREQHRQIARRTFRNCAKLLAA